MPAPPTEPRPHSPLFDVPLPDLSEVTYEKVREGFPPPPGVQTRVAPAATGRHGEPVEQHSVLPPGIARDVLTQLALAQRAIAGELRAEPIQLVLPTQAAPGHYRIHGPGEQFYVRAEDGSRELRALSQALPGRGLGEQRQADPLDRLELVRLVAAAVASLHARDLVTAGLDLDTFAFALTPRPEVAVVRPDRLRSMGGEFLTTTEIRDEWDSPDRDRFDFGVLSYRLLVGLRDTADIDLGHRPHVPGLDGRQVNEMWRLWQRTTGPAGTRPQMSEWMRGLKP